MGDSTDHGRFIAELEARLEKLGIELGTAMYNLYLGDNSADLNEIEARISSIYSDPESFDKLSRATASQLDTKTRLAVNRLRRWFTINQIRRHPDVFKLRNEIEKKLLSFRPMVGGAHTTRSQAREILRKEELRRLRKEAYYCEMPLAQEVRPQVIELVKLRRDLARELGADNYPDLVLTLQDNDLEDLKTLFKLLEEQTVIQFGNYLLHLTAESSIDELKPWDVDYLFARKRLPDRAFPKEGIIPAVKEVFGGAGFNIDALGVDVKYHDIPFGGLCFGITIPDDVRILANPMNGHSYYITLFHEFGHAVYDKLISQEHYALKTDSSSCFTEGIAVFFSRFAEDRDWLVQRDGLTERQVEDYVNRRSYSRMLRLRRLIAGALLEYHIYEDPDQDIEGLSAQLLHKFMLVKSEPSELWAANPFNVSHPVYLQNYVLAEMIAQQIYNYLRHHYAMLLGNRAVGKFMIRNFFAKGGETPWRDKIVYATDRPLGPEALLADLGVK
jgi:peptidyl-dipeptidase A